MALFDKFAQKPGRKSDLIYTPESDYEAWMGIYMRVFQPMAMTAIPK